MAKSDRLYKDSPKLERDKESGEMAINKAPGQADKEDMGLAGHAVPGTPGEMPVELVHQHDRREMHHKHAKEVLDMHSKHEMEHAAHKGGEKKKLTAHHEKEHKEMHERHEKEMEEMHKKHEDLKHGSMEKESKEKE